MRAADHGLRGYPNEVRHPDGIEDVDGDPDIGSVRPVPLRLRLLFCQLGNVLC
jgi:hypothetical protein